MSPSRASHVKRGEEAKLAMKNKFPLPQAASEKGPSIDIVGVDTITDAREKHTQAVKKTISRLKMKALQEARHGLYIPLTPRTVEKKWKTKERIRKIIATLKISPRPFERGGGMAKQWRIRPNSGESQVVKKIREKLHVRNAKMKPFTSKKIFHDILEVCEDEEKVEDPIKASIASKFEYMARELIDKTAYMQAREQHGPWSRTGLPYLCLGAPSLNRPATAPLPNLDKLQKDSFAEYPFDFFPMPSNITNMLVLAADTAPRSKVARRISRKEAILKAAQTNSTMSRLLTKMGLLHLHDMDYARFPQDQIFLTEELKKIAKKGGTWLEDMHEGMMNVSPRALSVIPYIGRTLVGISGNIERFGETDSSSTMSEEDHSKQSKAHQHSKSDKHTNKKIQGFQTHKYLIPHESFEPSESGIIEILVEPQPAPTEVVWNPDQSRIFNMKKGNLFQRKLMQYDLSWGLTSISDRRTHWRSNAIFSAEICNRIEALLFATKGRRTPSTKHIWEVVEKHHPFKSKEDAPAFESEVQSINRFYERVCRFIDHQKMADPLMDVLVYFLKEIFEKDGLTLQAEVLFRLCKRLASLPEDVANSGRMVCIMPILQFIAKELRLTSTEFDQYITESGVDRMQQIPAYIPSQA